MPLAQLTERRLSVDLDVLSQWLAMNYSAGNGSLLSRITYWNIGTWSAVIKGRRSKSPIPALSKLIAPIIVIGDCDLTFAAV
jgi:hypothetical protein